MVEFTVEVSGRPYCLQVTFREKVSPLGDETPRQTVPVKRTLQTHNLINAAFSVEGKYNNPSLSPLCGGIGVRYHHPSSAGTGEKMDLTELAVAQFLTRNGLAFVCPQFDFPADKGEGGSSPDFVAIDFANRDIVVVEVTTSANLKGLLARISDREKRWYEPLRQQEPLWSSLRSLGFGEPRFIGFIRESLVGGAYEALCDESGRLPDDTTFYPLEHTYSPWLYWNERGTRNGRMPDIRDLLRQW